jgi:hypothetical protein
MRADAGARQSRLLILGASMFKIAIIVWMMAATVLAGFAIIVVLTVPSLATRDMQYIPIAALVGAVIAIPVAYLVAKRIAALTARS